MQLWPCISYCRCEEACSRSNFHLTVQQTLSSPGESGPNQAVKPGSHIPRSDPGMAFNVASCPHSLIKMAKVQLDESGQ